MVSVSVVLLPSSVTRSRGGSLILRGFTVVVVGGIGTAGQSGWNKKNLTAEECPHSFWCTRSKQLKGKLLPELNSLSPARHFSLGAEHLGPHEIRNNPFTERWMCSGLKWAEHILADLEGLKFSLFKFASQRLHRGSSENGKLKKGLN